MSVTQISRRSSISTLARTGLLKNPYPKKPGFGLRVYHSEKAIRRLSDDPGANIYTRGFDNCFENGDGNAVVFALMHKAYAERAEHPRGYSQLAEGIGFMFRGRTSLDGFPLTWEAIAWPVQQVDSLSETLSNVQTEFTL